MQQPLAEIVVFHPDQQYLDDVKMLQSYVEEELNVHKVTFTSDEAPYGVWYKVSADWTVLGKKLRKDAGRVRKGLEKVTSDQVKAFIESGKIDVDGVELVSGDLLPSRYVDASAVTSAVTGADDAPSYESNTDEDVVVLLDCRLRRNLELEGFARELMNRVQKLRKKAGLVQTDDIQMYYGFADGATAESKEMFEEVLEKKGDVIIRVLKLAPKPIKDHRPQEQQVIIDEEQEKWGDQQVTFTLARL